MLFDLNNFNCILRRLHHYFIFLFSIHTFSTFAQTGCTDAQAINFDPLAITNDGSCLYPPTSLTFNLNCVLDTPLLNECSGIAYLNGNLWVHVDNTDTFIYRIDSISNSVFHAVSVNNTINVDWEDITFGNGNLFIGDFGNNSGNRTDLRILKISENCLTDTSTSAIPDFINFTYSDQNDFTPSLNNTRFDCEAFFFFNDSLHLFTKDWVTKWTKQYILPADSGNYIAQLVDSFFVNGLITSAAIQNDGLITLLAYDNTGIAPCFIWMFYDYQPYSFFSGNKRLLSLGSAISVGQTEGICLNGNNKGYITNERFQYLNFEAPAQLKSFNLSPFLPDTSSMLIHTSTDSQTIKIVPDFANNKLLIDIPDAIVSNYSIILTDVSGKQMATYKIENNRTSFDLKEISNGLFFITLFSNSKMIKSYKFYK